MGRGVVVEWVWGGRGVQVVDEGGEEEVGIASWAAGHW